MSTSLAPPEDAITLTFHLPRAPESLSPNKRGHTASNSGERGAYRDGCAWAISEELKRWRKANPQAPGLGLPLWTRIIYGTKSLGPADESYKPRDNHNVHGPGKALVDALAQAMDFNDSAKNAHDLGAEIDNKSTEVLLVVYFTPITPSIPTNPQEKDIMDKSAPESTNAEASQLAPISAGIELPEGMVLTATGLLLPEKVDKDDFTSALKKMAQANKVFGFAMADLIVHGEDNFSSSIKELLAENGIEPETIRRHCWIARKIPVARRRTDVLSLTHHEHVAALSPDKQDMYLSLAFSEKLSASQLHARILQDGAKSRRPKIQDASPINGVDLKTGNREPAGKSNSAKRPEDEELTDPWGDEEEVDKRIKRTLAATKGLDKDPDQQSQAPAPPPITTPPPVPPQPEPVIEMERIPEGEEVAVVPIGAGGLSGATGGLGGAVLQPKEIDLLAPITWAATLGVRTVTMTEQIGAGGRLEHIITLDGVRQSPDPTNPMAAKSRAEALLRQQ